MQPIVVGRILADQIWLFDGLTAAVWTHPVRYIIPPGILLPLDSATRGLLPFSLRRETIGSPTHVAQPATIGAGLKPTDRDHRLI
jgi:hypothetical protein